MTATTQAPYTLPNNVPARIPRVRMLALAGIVGPIWFTTLVIIQGFLLADYSHVRLPISALAAWPTGWIQNINFFVFGSLMMVYAFSLNRGVQRTRQGSIGFALLLLSGLGIVLAGVFPFRMVDGVPTENALHVVASIMAFASMALGLLVFSRRMVADPRWRDLATYTMFTGIIVLTLFVVLGRFAIDDGAPLHPWAGLIQRIVCGVWFANMIVLSVRLRAVGQSFSGYSHANHGRA